MWDRYKKAYAPKRDATKDEAARLIAFARLVHKADDATFRKELGSYLDVDGWKYWRSNTLDGSGGLIVNRARLLGAAP